MSLEEHIIQALRRSGEVCTDPDWSETFCISDGDWKILTAWMNPVRVQSFLGIQYFWHGKYKIRPAYQNMQEVDKIWNELKEKQIAGN